MKSLAGEKNCTWNRDIINWAFVAVELRGEITTFNKRDAMILKYCATRLMATRQIIHIYSQIIKCGQDIILFQERLGEYYDMR